MTSHVAAEVEQQTALSAEAARWRCLPESLGFSRTSELSPRDNILGQEDAVTALRYGLENRLKGNNVFVRGLSGFGRTALIHEVIEDLELQPANASDLCYIHNFEAPDQPQLLSLPCGRGLEFRDQMDDFAEFVTVELPQFLSSDYIKGKVKQLIATHQEQLKVLGQPFEADLQAAGLVMVPMQVGQNTIPVILPVIEGKAVQFEELQQMRLDGRIPEEEFAAIVEKISGFEKTLGEIGEQVQAKQATQRDEQRQLYMQEATVFVEARIKAIQARFQIDAVAEFLTRVQQDLIHHRLTEQASSEDFSRFYRVNLISHHLADERRKVINLNTPNLSSLVGKIDRTMIANAGLALSDHLMIKPGALLDASGGFLIIEAQDLLNEPGAWQALLRTLKSGSLEINQSEYLLPWSATQLRPEPIPVDVKVVLVGDPEIYQLLDMYERRFASMFKILADFGDTMPRDKSGFDAYANVVARLVKRDGLLDLSAAAIARLIEHGARICSQKGQLTSRFGRIADITREASFIAQGENAELVSADHVSAAIANSKRRADLPARRFRRMIGEGTLRIDVKGEEVGQVNGLAVATAGPLTFGFPTRITASIGPGSAGAINIERESSLSGSVHTKGFLILSGLLRHKLKLDHPLAFSASIAFEQTYGGIDGDSASGAEFCCLMSALTGIPLRQNLAMTGAIDQKGHILPIGGVTEKIEGFYDACQSVEFTGSQGVVIPTANAGELMLREDVVAAIAEGKFHVYAIENIDQALALLLNEKAGSFVDGEYETGSILHGAREKAHAYWETARALKN